MLFGMNYMVCCGSYIKGKSRKLSGLLDGRGILRSCGSSSMFNCG